MEHIYKEFGQRLRIARKTAKLSQQQVGVSVDLNRTSITNIESGRQHINLHTFFRLASAVGVKPESLLPQWTDNVVNDPATERAIQKIGLSDEVTDWLRTILATDKAIRNGEKI